MRILTRGRVPQVPHTELYSKPGVLALEEIHGTCGFSGAWARKLHLRSYPTEQAAEPRSSGFSLAPRPARDAALRPFHVRTGRMPREGDPIRGRRTLFFGPSTAISVAKPSRAMPEGCFFRNGEKHELYFVQQGSGTLATEYGELPVRPGLYLCVPKGTTYRLDLRGQAHLLLVESSYPIAFPSAYMNPAGQAKMTAPVVETEIEEPAFRPPIDRRGRFFVDVRHGGGRATRLGLSHHPFDLIGWEGALYPFGFDSASHHAIARDIHVAPPAHQTFESGAAPWHGFSVCSFIPQPEGWHPRNVPAPYAHLNVDSDEVMFFADGEYSARKGIIEPGSMTFHPGSLPHSPHGRAAEASLKDRGRMGRRLAVMLDTFFESLTPTETAWRWRDKGYSLSWFKAAH